VDFSQFGTSLKWLGIALFAAGFLCSLSALAFVEPGRSRTVAYFRGSFQAREDYSSTGWRLVIIGRVLCLGGVLLVVLAMFVFAA
jgi:hypothetical protein